MNLLKQLCRTRNDINLRLSKVMQHYNAVCNQITSYVINQRKQLHIQTLLKCHFAAFCTTHSDFKKQPNDNICKAMFALVYYIAIQLVTYSITQCCINSLSRKLISVLVLGSCFNRLWLVLQSTWPQLDINSCSYQLY